MTNQNNSSSLYDLDDETFKNTLNSYSKQSKRNIKFLLAIFTVGILIMGYIVYTFPEISK